METTNSPKISMGVRVPHPLYYNIHTGYWQTINSRGKVSGLHRVLMEQKLGRFLSPTEVTHHIDGDKSNNCYENLEIKNKGRHATEHQIRAKEITLECPICKHIFSIRYKFYIWKKNKGQKTFSCSRKCRGTASKQFNKRRYYG